MAITKIKQANKKWRHEQRRREKRRIEKLRWERKAAAVRQRRADITNRRAAQAAEINNLISEVQSEAEV